MCIAKKDKRKISRGQLKVNETSASPNRQSPTDGRTSPDGPNRQAGPRERGPPQVVRNAPVKQEIEKTNAAKTAEPIRKDDKSAEMNALPEISLDVDKQNDLWGKKTENKPNKKEEMKKREADTKKEVPLSAIKPVISENKAPKKKPSQARTKIETKKIPDRDEFSACLNDKTEFLENAQLTKLMSNAEIRAVIGGQMSHGVDNDENSCRDTIDEVDSEMQDIIFSPLLIPTSKEDVPVVFTNPDSKKATV